MTTPGGQLTPGDEPEIGDPPVYGVPSGAYVGDAGSPQSFKDLNSLNKDEAKRRMQAPISGSFTRQRDSQWGLVQNIIDMVNGRYKGTLPTFIDGQLAINNRFDLLGTSAYCAAYMGSNLRLGPGRNRALPFDSKIGPSNDAEIVRVNRSHPGASGGPRGEWCIRLDRRGLWQADVAFVHAGDGYDVGFAEIVVLKPDLTPYSYTTLPTARAHADSGGVSDLARGVPVVIPKRFVVPEPGYYVQVRWWYSVLVGVRTAKGGAKMSQFSVVQWSDDVDNVATDDSAIGTIDDV